jgi:hypothetical protein
MEEVGGGMGEIEDNYVLLMMGEDNYDESLYADQEEEEEEGQLKVLPRRGLGHVYAGRSYGSNYGGRSHSYMGGYGGGYRDNDMYGYGRHGGYHYSSSSSGSYGNRYHHSGYDNDGYGD